MSDEEASRLPLYSSTAVLSPVGEQQINRKKRSNRFKFVFSLVPAIAMLVVDIVFVVDLANSWRGESLLGAYLFSLLASRLVNMTLYRYYDYIFLGINNISLTLVYAFGAGATRRLIGNSKESMGVLRLLLDEDYVNVDKDYLAMSTFEFIYMLLADLPQMILAIIAIATIHSVAVTGVICLIFKIISILFYVISYFKSPMFKPIAKALLKKLAD